MKYLFTALLALRLALSQTGCTGVYDVSSGPGYYGPTYPAVNWGGAGFYGGSYYRGAGWNNNYYHGGSSSWNHGSGSWSGSHGGSASWSHGSGSWSGSRGGSGSWSRR